MSAVKLVEILAQSLALLFVPALSLLMWAWLALAKLFSKPDVRFAV